MAGEQFGAHDAGLFTLGPYSREPWDRKGEVAKRRVEKKDERNKSEYKGLEARKRWRAIIGVGGKREKLK